MAAAMVEHQVPRVTVDGRHDSKATYRAVEWFGKRDVRVDPARPKPLVTDTVRPRHARGAPAGTRGDDDSAAGALGLFCKLMRFSPGSDMESWTLVAACQVVFDRYAAEAGKA